MNKPIKQFSINAIILITVAFVWLPCSLKHDIKEAIQIHITTLVNTQKPNKTAVCQVFTKNETIQNIVKHPKNQILFTNFRFRVLINFSIISHAQFAQFRPKNSQLVPIYILHEQYII